MSRISHMVKIYRNDGKPIRVLKTPSRNEPCPCMSGSKFKHCHIGNWEEFVREEIAKYNQQNQEV